jgi:hypothetical protein
MLMPEAAMHLDDGSIARQDDVRAPGQARIVKAKPKTVPMQEASNR